jgi:hypothetical protein
MRVATPDPFVLKGARVGRNDFTILVEEDLAWEGLSTCNLSHTFLVTLVTTVMSCGSFMKYEVIQI